MLVASLRLSIADWQSLIRLVISATWLGNVAMVPSAGRIQELCNGI